MLNPSECQYISNELDRLSASVRDGKRGAIEFSRYCESLVRIVLPSAPNPTPVAKIMDEEIGKQAVLNAKLEENAKAPEPTGAELAGKVCEFPDFGSLWLKFTRLAKEQP